MRKLKFYSFVVILLLSAKIAGANVEITQFSPKNGSAINHSNGTATNLTARIDLVKIGQYYNTIALYLIHRQSNGAETVIGDTTIFDGNFPPNGLMSIDMQGTIPAEKTNGNIYLKYTLYDGSVQGATSYTFTFLQVNYGQTTPPPPTYISPTEGKLVRRVADSKVYIVMQGKFRHIQNASTLQGVWRTELLVSENAQIQSSDLGTPIGPNTKLIRHTANGAIYYQEDGVIRHITSQSAADKYAFNLSKAQNVSNLNGLTVGSAFY